LSERDLEAVQKRRLMPTRLTQGAQIVAQNRILRPALTGTGRGNDIPFLLRLLDRFPLLRRLPARLIGLGVRPEHVRRS
jgi:hypothetical protein